MVRSIQIMNIETREIKEFYSVTDCAAFFGVSRARIVQRIKYTDVQIPYHGHYIKYKDNAFNWPEKPKDGANYNSIILTNVMTGDVEKFSSIAKASKKIKACAHTVAEYAKAKDLIPFKGYYIRYAV